MDGSPLAWSSRLRRKLMPGREYSRDHGLDYSVFRGWDQSRIGEVVESFQPDIVVVQSTQPEPQTRALTPTGAPLVTYSHEVEEIGHLRFLQGSGIPVSVVSPVFDTRPDELRAAVEPALGQEGASVYELILADDASTASETLAMLDALGPEDGRVVVARAAAWNLALDCATGDWFGIILDGLHLGTCLIERSLIGERRFDPGVQFGEDLLFLAKLSVLAGADRAPGLSYLCRREHESMMYSPARLTDRFATGALAGYRDQELRPFRREYRRALYDIYKDLAVNNLLNGRRGRALRFVLRALLLDPREVGELGRFLTLLPRGPRDEALARGAGRYSKREQVVLPGP